jgi:hypothetical protein
VTAGNFRQPIVDLSAGAVPTQQLTSQPRNPAGTKFPWFKIILSGITAARHGSATWSASSFVGGHASDWCALSRNKKVARQHGNAVADSLPSGSGDLDVHLGRQRLPLAYLLRTLELDQRAVKGLYEAGFVTQ